MRHDTNQAPARVYLPAAKPAAAPSKQCPSWADPWADPRPLLPLPRSRWLAWLAYSLPTWAMSTFSEPLITKYPPWS